MTDVTALSGAAASTQTSARTSVAGNYEMFLTLLTEQLKNQDPLDPLDSSEYVAQLVEFSNVEQSIRQTETLESMLANQLGSTGAAAVAYIGRDAHIEGAQAPLQDGAARWSYTLSAQTAETAIAVLDDAGKVVFETSGETSPGNHAFTWDGLDASGAPLAPGTYTLSVGAKNGEGDALNPAITAYGRVTGVDLAGAAPSVTLGDLKVGLGGVRSVSEIS